MPVKRNRDGSVTIKNNNGVTVIGKIVKVSYDKQEEKFKRWVDDCAKLVTACAHTLKETEQYFLEHCHALPIASDDRRMKGCQLNVVMNYCKDKLKHKPSNFSFDMTDEEMERWYQEDEAMRKEIFNSPPEHFGLKIRGYYLPQTEENKEIYEQSQLTEQRWIRDKEGRAIPTDEIVKQDICFFFEETTEYIQSTGGGDNLLQQLIVYKGVTEEDIEKRSPRFLGYISLLRNMGKLPDFPKE